MQVNLAQAITLLKNGDVVAIPTETVYGLAADATNEAALLQVYAIKQRPADNPLIVHIADANQVHNWAAEFPPLAQKLALAFWPGPFTLVLRARDSVSNIVRGNHPTVALRVPNHPITQQLLKQSGLALAAPSANKFTQLSPTTAAHVASGLGDSVPVLDGGACKVGIESTIVAVIGEEWQLLRLGMLPEASIEALAGRPALSSKQAIRVPGQHVLHYSPKTPVKLFQSRKELINFVLTPQNNCAALLFGAGEYPSCHYVQLPNQAAKAAEALYGALHQLDALQVTQLLVEMPPRTTEWAAVNDRLSRAAHQG